MSVLGLWNSLQLNPFVKTRLCLGINMRKGGNSIFLFRQIYSMDQSNHFLCDLGK